MKPSTTRRLLDAREAAHQIHQIVIAESFDDLRRDPLLLLGVVKLFEIIGESLNRARQGEPNVEGAIPRLRRYVNLRNLLVHEYDKIDYPLVWQTAEEGIPELLDALVRATAHADEAGSQPKQAQSSERRRSRQRT